MNPGRDQEEPEGIDAAPGNDAQSAPGSKPIEVQPHGGAEVAPTERAEERERVRHREERKRGRTAAGVGNNQRGHSKPEVTREDLEEAAQIADRTVSPKR
jgi:hypothetical protein